MLKTATYFRPAQFDGNWKIYSDFDVRGSMWGEDWDSRTLLLLLSVGIEMKWKVCISFER